MLFFVVCACFALFPAQVLYGAQNGLALCINAVIPSLLPFMLVSLCVIKSGFSRPLGVALSKVLTPFVSLSTAGCVAFVTGLFGGYGAGAKAVYESYKEGQLSKAEAESLLPFCNNAGPLFVIATVGISFYLSKTLGVMLFLIQVITALICARFFTTTKDEKGERLKDAWNYYKKNKPSIGELITKSAVESAAAIMNVCVFVITFSAILEILPLGEYRTLSGILEVTRGVAELSRDGETAIPFISALLSWGGVCVHFQASALTKGELDMKPYYLGKIIASAISYIITLAICSDTYMFLYLAIGFVLIIFFLKYIQQLLFRQRRRS